MGSMGIIGGADGPTAVLVSSELSPWAVILFVAAAVCSVSSVVLGLVALHKATQAEEKDK